MKAKIIIIIIIIIIRIRIRIIIKIIGLIEDTHRKERNHINLKRQTNRIGKETKKLFFKQWLILKIIPSKESKIL